MKTVLAACLAAALTLTAQLQGGEISVGETRIDNGYPEQMVFEVAVSSSAPLSRVELHVAVRGDTSTSVVVAAFDPGTTTTAKAVWKPRQEGVPPGASFTYRWRVWDEAGASLTTPEEAGLALDPRREWSSLMDDQVAVWWYAGDAAFGERIYDLAATSLSLMRRESGFELPDQLRVVLYADAEAFAEWHEYVPDWVGGEAYPEMGLTVQVISPLDSWDWVQSVISHEVAHLFFHQATYHAISLGPATWISEGYAVYHEYVSSAWPGEMVSEAMRDGDLVPLRLATGSFSGDDEHILLLYAESWSAVTFLYDRWGAEGMAQLMEAFREGAESNDALRAATGMDFEEFQLAWWEWLGGEPGAYPTLVSPVPTSAIASPVARASATPILMTPLPAAVEEPAMPDGGRAPWPCAGSAAAPVLGVLAAFAGTRAKRRRPGPLA